MLHPGVNSGPGYYGHSNGCADGQKVHVFLAGFAEESSGNHRAPSLLGRPEVPSEALSLSPYWVSGEPAIRPENVAYSSGLLPAGTDVKTINLGKSVAEKSNHKKGNT